MGARKPDSAKPLRAVLSHARTGREQSVAMLGPYRRVELEEIASESSEAERRADGAERELMDWKTAQFMESHLGEEYEALIISVQKFGFFVELVEIFVEGLVSIDRLEETTGQRCVYRDRDHTIVTEPHRDSRAAKRIFRLGDRVRVRAERIDPVRHRVEFLAGLNAWSGVKIPFPCIARAAKRAEPERSRIENSNDDPEIPRE